MIVSVSEKPCYQSAFLIIKLGDIEREIHSDFVYTSKISEMISDEMNTEMVSEMRDEICVQKNGEFVFFDDNILEYIRNIIIKFN